MSFDFEWERAVSFIREYEWLIEFKIVDFITSSYWEREVIPKEWRVFVKNDLQTEEDPAQLLMTLADPFTFHNLRLPSSLLSFRQQIETYNEQIGRYSNKDQLSLVSKRRKNMREKKTYEIEVLAEVINDLLGSYGLERAVDVGSGQGYLAMELLERNEMLSIVGIECAEKQIHGTNERLKEYSEDIQKRFAVKKAFMTGDGEQWNDLISSSSESRDSRENYLIYSLHACGSLSESMLTAFCSSSAATSKARVLFNLPCCYNLINEELPGAHFPLSQAMQSKWGTTEGLTRNMKMVACQSPSRWIHRPSQTRSFFTRHFYRALLEQLLLEEYDIAQEVNEQDSGVRMEKISSCYLDSFVSYAQRALCSLNLPPMNADHLHQFYAKYCHLEVAIAFLWTMRALMGSVVEAVILWDRLLYAKEQLPSSRISIQPVLHHLKSPRNLALVIIKDPESTVRVDE